MSDFIETLWTQFVIETDEHIELIEPLLLEAEIKEPIREDIDQLFRSFHSIKGLVMAMDLLGMETIAHRAEDILGLVRDEVITVDAALAGTLLDAVDALKQHVRIAESERQDRAPSEELIARLKSVYNRAKGEPDSGTDEHTTDVQAAPASPSEHETVQLHVDPDMVVFFTEILQASLPGLADLLSPKFSTKSVSGKALVDELETLTHASTTMEYCSLATRFSAITELIPKKGAPKGAVREALIDELAAIVDLTLFIEKEVQVQCGVSPLVDSLRTVVTEKVDLVFPELNDLLQTAKDELASDATALVDILSEISRKTRPLRNHLQTLCSGDNARRLLLTVEEVCDYIVAGQASPEPEILELVHDALRAAEREHHSERTGEGECNSPVDWGAMHSRIWSVIRQQCVTASGEKLLSFGELVAQIGINPAFESYLSCDHSLLLQEWMKGDGPVYELLVNLDESEDVTARVLQWMTSESPAAGNVQVLTSRVVSIGDKPWSEFLLLSTETDRELRERVKTLDPERKYLKLKSCAYAVEQTQAEAPAVAETPVKEQSMLRVSGATLDQFMNQIGEMVSIRGMLNHTVHSEGAATAFSQLKQCISGFHQMDFKSELLLQQLELLEIQFSRLDQIDQKMRATLSQLQDSALALRVVPMETVFKRFPRAVRDLSLAQGKQVRLDMVGQDVRIDKAMVEVLSDPLMHMVRNSVDHGIELTEERVAAGKAERATIRLEARQRGNAVNVTITDDGRGIDVEAVRVKARVKGLASEEELQRMSSEEIMEFIFAAGFSTADQITETSGRGVGMDVVRTNVTRLGGRVSVSSEAGKGSSFTLELPLSAAIQDTILVQASGQMMAIPERYVSEMIEAKRSDLQLVKGCQAIVLRDSFLPVYRLGPLLGYPAAQGEPDEEMVVAVLSDGKQRIGVVIDRSYQRQELFIKDIHEQLIALPGVSGASILGDGKVVLILDVEDLFMLAARRGRTALHEKAIDVAAEVRVA